MDIKITNSALYKFEKEFGKSLTEIDDNAGFSTIIELAFCGWQGEGTFDDFLKEVDGVPTVGLTELVADAIKESFPEPEGN